VTLSLRPGAAGRLPRTGDARREDPPAAALSTNGDMGFQKAPGSSARARPQGPLAAKPRLRQAAGAARGGGASLAYNFAATSAGHDRGGAAGLPAALKAGVESLSGLSMDGVRVHRDSAQPGRLNAHALTVGRDIHLAPGQEQQLPHEAWHVVQQLSGRAAAARGAVVEAPHLEEEADRMGARAAAGGAARPAPAPARQAAATAAAGPPVVQLKNKVPVPPFGLFETTTFAPVNGKDGAGVDITLLFRPDDKKVNATKIALSQSVRATTAKGKTYAAYGDQDGKMVPAGQPGAGFTLDVPAGSNNPLYAPESASLGPKQDLKDTPMSDNTTKDPTQLGTNAHFQLGFCFQEKPGDKDKKIQPAGLVDQALGGANKGESKMFETAALAIDGADKDTYYGSVKWGYKIGGKAGAPVEPMDIELASSKTGAPSPNFTAAAKQFGNRQAQKTLRVGVEDAPIIKLDPSNPSARPVAGKLAKGTKLRQVAFLLVGEDPGIQAEVLKADGTGTGTFVFIASDALEDMHDGAPNKKLPPPK
jgi:hypothetical protein